MKVNVCVDYFDTGDYLRSHYFKLENIPIELERFDSYIAEYTAAIHKAGFLLIDAIDSVYDRREFVVIPWQHIVSIRFGIDESEQL